MIQSFQENYNFSFIFCSQCPATAYYIPSFLSKQDEEAILAQIDNTPKPKWTQLSHRRLINYGGVPHKNGMITEEMPIWLKDKVAQLNNLGENKTIENKMKLPCNKLIQCFVLFLGVFGDVKANHVLVNEYLPGQGIMAHSDGPLFHPVISTVSCGSHTILQFYEETQANENHTNGNIEINDTQAAINAYRKPVCQLLIEAGSLVVLKDDMYKKYLHSIEEISSDLITSDIANIDRCAVEFKDKIGKTVERGRRISLTIRNVPKTSKVQLKLGH